MRAIPRGPDCPRSSLSMGRVRESAFSSSEDPLFSFCRLRQRRAVPSREKRVPWLDDRVAPREKRVPSRERTVLWAQERVPSRLEPLHRAEKYGYRGDKRVSFDERTVRGLAWTGPSRRRDPPFAGETRSSTRPTRCPAGETCSRAQGLQSLREGKGPRAGRGPFLLLRPPPLTLTKARLAPSTALDPGGHAAIAADIVLERRRRIRLADRSPRLAHMNVVLSARIDLPPFVEPQLAPAEAALHARAQGLFAKGRREWLPLRATTGRASQSSSSERA
jgi:hypothetical protein